MKVLVTHSSRAVSLIMTMSKRNGEQARIPSEKELESPQQQRPHKKSKSPGLFASQPLAGHSAPRWRGTALHRHDCTDTTTHAHCKSNTEDKDPVTAAGHDGPSGPDQ